MCTFRGTLLNVLTASKFLTQNNTHTYITHTHTMSHTHTHTMSHTHSHDVTHPMWAVPCRAPAEVRAEVWLETGV